LYTQKRGTDLFIKDKQAGSSNRQFYLQTGFESIDEHFMTLIPGNLMVIGAAPAMGKRAFVFSMMRNWKLDDYSESVRVRYFTLEISAQEIFERIVSVNYGKPVYKVVDELDLMNVDATNLSETLSLFEHKPIIDEEQFDDFLDLIERIRYDQQSLKSNVFVIDHLQALGSYKKSKREVSLCLKALKNIAMEYGVVIILLSQLAKTVYKQKKKIPHFSDLMRIGPFKKYADFLLLLHRPEYYGYVTAKNGKSNMGIMYVYGLENRRGKSFKSILKLDCSSNLVRELE
jgi:replicative DNA helicase